MDTTLGRATRRQAFRSAIGVRGTAALIVALILAGGILHGEAFGRGLPALGADRDAIRAGDASGPASLASRLHDPARSCLGVKQFRTARCNDLRHFGPLVEGPPNTHSLTRPAPECVEADSFRTAKCNDVRHFGPLAH